MGDHDIEVEFNFVKYSQAMNPAAIERTMKSTNLEENQHSPIEFSCVPNTLKIPAQP